MARILMVYEADSGPVSAVMDTLHKLVRPETYPCRLCALTYGWFGMKKAWAETVAALPHPVEFLHRDEWRARFPGTAFPFPAILLEKEGAFETLISATEFEGLTTLDALQALLLSRVMPGRGVDDPSSPRVRPAGRRPVGLAGPDAR